MNARLSSLTYALAFVAAWGVTTGRVAFGQTEQRVCQPCPHTWQTVGNGFGFEPPATAPTTYALAEFGSRIYAGGDFKLLNSSTACCLARLDGAAWSAIGPIVPGPPINNDKPNVRALTVFDLGVGPRLYVGGAFWTIGGVTLNHVGEFNGSFVPLGSGINLNGGVVTIAGHDTAGGPLLYAGGGFKGNKPPQRP